MSSLVFNANEVFEVAKQIERNCAAFYRSAADLMSDESSAALLKELANMEMTHERIFEAMQEGLAGNESGEAPYDSHEDAYDFLREMADKYVFNPAVSPWAVLKQQATIEAIFDFAIQREKDSVLFYEGIKLLVPPDLGGARLDEIISQEMGHIVLLSKQLRNLTLKP